MREDKKNGLLPESDPGYARLNWLRNIEPEKRILTGHSFLIAKRIMDLSLVVLSVPVWLPLLVICALMIKICSPGGPVFFSQWRTGKGGTRFRMYKFRTMVPGAEEMKKELGHLNQLAWPDFKIKNDPRTTKVGRLLRKMSLDELPQIWNVVKGEMSLVGPRPTSFSPETYQLWQTERLEVRPGITGLWQIVGRGSTEFDFRIRLDIAYIERQCLWLDIQILLRTFGSVFRQRGTF